MPTFRKYPPPRLGRVAWPPDPGLRWTLLLSVAAHVLLVLLFFFNLLDLMPQRAPMPVYRVEVVGLQELPPPVELPPEPVVRPPAAPKPVKSVPVLPKPSPPTVAVTPPPKPVPVAVVQPPPPRELPQPQNMPQRRVTVEPAPTSALPDAPALVRSARDPELNVPDRSVPVARTRVQTAPLLDDNRPLVTARNDTAVSGTPTTIRPYQQRSAEPQAALPDSNMAVLPSTTRSAAIAAPELNAVRPSSPRSSAADVLPGSATAPVVGTRSEQNFAAPTVSSPTKPSRAAATVAMAPTERGFVTPRPSGADPLIPTNVGVKGTTAPTTRRLEPAAGPGDVAPGLRSARAGAQIDQTSMAYFGKLKTCLDTEKEMNLKTRLATLLDQDKSCEAGGSVFYFAAPDTAYTLRVGVSPGPGVAFRDRCEALSAALRCVEQKP